MLLDVFRRITDPPRAAREALIAQGAATARRLLDKSTARVLRSAVEEMFAEIAAFGRFADPDFGHHFRNSNNIWVAGLPAQLAAMGKKPDRYADVFEAIYERVRGMFGAHWKEMPQSSFIRRHLGAKTHLPWHIDADAANTISQAGGGDCINVWMPLCAVGRRAPSLDIVPGSHAEMKTRPLLASAEASRDDAFVASIGKAYAPKLDLGDALACDQYTLHRTQAGDFSNVTRTACEFRFRSEANTSQPS